MEKHRYILIGFALFRLAARFEITIQFDCPVLDMIILILFVKHVAVASYPWCAYDGAEGENAPPIRADKIRFKSREDILTEESHTWTLEMDRGQEGSFKTTHL